MHKLGSLLAVFLIAAAPPTARADGEIGDVRARIDGAVASVVEGEIGPAADDASFLRRVWIDLAGRTPPALVVRDFLDDTSPERRAKMVARLLDSETFADHWDRLLFRDYQVAHPPVAREYQDLKYRLASAYPNDRVAYTKGKTEFVVQVTADARQFCGKG